jgi:hypothetical protein
MSLLALLLLLWWLCCHHFFQSCPELHQRVLGDPAVGIASDLAESLAEGWISSNKMLQGTQVWKPTCGQLNQGGIPVSVGSLQEMGAAVLVHAFGLTHTTSAVGRHE